MNPIFEAFIEALKRGWEWFVDSGLAEDTANAIGGIITNTSDTLIPLMWDYINKFFGVTIV